MTIIITTYILENSREALISIMMEAYHQKITSEAIQYQVKLTLILIIEPDVTIPSPLAGMISNFLPNDMMISCSMLDISTVIGQGLCAKSTLLLDCMIH